MKWIGAVMVVLGCVLAALRYVSELQRKLGTLEELRDDLELIEGEIRYGKASLPECFLMVGAQKKTDLGRMFGELGKQTAEGTRDSLRDAMEKALGGVLEAVLPPEEFARFFEFASPRGYAEEEMQRRVLGRSREKLEALLKERRAQLRGKCRVAWSLGLTGGFFVILLLW